MISNITPSRNPETDLMELEVTKEYALAFQLLDDGYPIPVDLETTLMMQGYNVPHLYDLFD